MCVSACVYVCIPFQHNFYIMENLVEKKLNSHLISLGFKSKQKNFYAPESRKVTTNQYVVP